MNRSINWCCFGWILLFAMAGYSENPSPPSKAVPAADKRPSLSPDEARLLAERERKAFDEARRDFKNEFRSTQVALSKSKMEVKDLAEAIHQVDVCVQHIGDPDKQYTDPGVRAQVKGFCTLLQRFRELARKQKEILAFQQAGETALEESEDRIDHLPKINRATATDNEIAENNRQAAQLKTVRRDIRHQLRDLDKKADTNLPLLNQAALDLDNFK
jgi:hypothetical protein